MFYIEGSVDTIRRKIEVFKDAGLTDAVKEEETKLAQLLAPPASGWLIENWLPSGHKGQLTAPEGSFKTIWMSYLVVCIASGNMVLGNKVLQGPVIIIDEETPLGSLKKHLNRFSQGLGYTSYDVLPITVMSMTGFRLGRKTEFDKLLNYL
jgi:RecA-family ATPase